MIQSMAHLDYLQLEEIKKADLYKYISNDKKTNKCTKNLLLLFNRREFYGII